MNNEQAKFILQGYRPNGADSADADVVAAMEQAKRDPALGVWFAKEQAFDAAISAKLGEVVPPAGLRDAILAGGRMSETSRPVRAWWNRPAWLAAAAGVAVLLTAGVAVWRNQAAGLEEFALADAKLSATHGGHGHENNELQAVLNNPGTRLGQKLPISFVNLHETGCRTVSHRGHDVLELCFKRNGVWFHAYFVRKSDYPQAIAQTVPRLTDHGSISMAMWSDAEHVIVVVSKTGRKNLEALL
jgi:hypothetical protein